MTCFTDVECIPELNQGYKIPLSNHSNIRFLSQPQSQQKSFEVLKVNTK